MELRKYQKETVEAVKRSRKSGINHQIIVLATGTGKTVIFSHLISELVKETGKKALIIAHREELLEQAKDKLSKIDGNLKIDIEQANRYANDDADVIVASVPTLGRTSSERIKRFNPRDFCIVVIDEAHHASADTYKNVLRHFGILKCESQSDWNKSLLLLGVTATPSRADNQGLDQIFDTVSHEYNIVSGIQEGFLSRIKAFRVNTATDLTGIHKVAGDFNQGELAEAVNNDDRNGLIIKAYKAIVPNQQALCFAVDVAHTKELSQSFERAGIRAGYVTGAISKDERHDTLSKFSTGEIKVVVNCMVLTEGFDEPSIQAILMARPTQSGILFQQMVGRGTRIFPGKENLTVIDFVDNTYRQNLQTTSSIVGIPGQLDFKGHDILSVKEEVDKLLELAPNADLSKLDIDKIKIAIEEVDLLSGLKVPEEIASTTRNDWHRYGEDAYKIGLGNDHSLYIRKTITGQQTLSDELYDREAKKVSETFVGQWTNLDVAIKSADYYINQKYPESLILIKNSASWRREVPTPKQIELLTKLRVNPIVLGQLNKGDASRLITKLLNQRRR